MRAAICRVAVMGAFLAGCDTPFPGSQVLFNLKGFLPPCDALAEYLRIKTAPGVEVSANDKPGVDLAQEWKTKCTTDEAKNRLVFHYELWATISASAFVKVKDFTIQRFVYPEEQFEFETDGVTLSNGKPFKIGTLKSYAEMSSEEKQGINTMMRQVSTRGYAVTSYSPVKFKAENPNELAPGLHVGNPLMYGSPHNGIFYGAVEGTAPSGGSTLGGVVVPVSYDLSTVDSLTVTIDLAPFDRDEPKPSSIIYLLTTRTEEERHGRRVIRLKGACPFNSEATATVAVMSSLDDEDYF